MGNIGYARVATPDQHLDEQLRQLETEGCTKIFSEKASGGDERRPVVLPTGQCAPRARDDGVDDQQGLRGMGRGTGG